MSVTRRNFLVRSSLSTAGLTPIFMPPKRRSWRALPGTTIGKPCVGSLISLLITFT
jgi:hypothetical protein